MSSGWMPPRGGGYRPGLNTNPRPQSKNTLKPPKQQGLAAARERPRGKVVYTLRPAWMGSDFRPWCDKHYDRYAAGLWRSFIG